jgi:protein gp37
MSDKTGIEWTDATWNPLTGCTKVSPGCDHCYAETLHERFNGPGSFATLTLRPERLDQPLRWRRPRRVFVNSMSDLFHQDVPDDYIARVFAVMCSCAAHTFQVLTKRHGRMRSLLNSGEFQAEVAEHARGVMRQGPSRQQNWPTTWPLPNVWLGVSVEDQHWADIRIPKLLATPAAVRFISAEPLLGEVSLFANSTVDTGTLIDWVIVGGESGPGARPMQPRWARQLRDECVRYGIPFLFKQWGAHVPVYRGEKVGEVMMRVGKKAAGRGLDGRTWDEYPVPA